MRFNWAVELHPIVVHFPIALLSVALLFDVAAQVRRSPALRTTAWYCLIAGAAGTVLAVVSGLITPDAREREGRAAARTTGLHLPDVQHFFSGRRVEVHEHWGYVLMAIVLVWLGLRTAVQLGKLPRSGLALTAGILAFAVLVTTGYYGGELVYRNRGRDRERGGAAIQRSAAATAGVPATAHTARAHR